MSTTGKPAEYGEPMPGSAADPSQKPLAAYRILAKNAGILVSPLQLGAMSLGGSWGGMLGKNDKAKSFEYLDAFVAAGGNFIDTASNYQNGESEIWIGEWMKERGNRDRLIIATKYTSPWRMHYEQNVNAMGNSKRSMMLSVKDSLKKLQTDWIDILYLHWWDWTTSIKEVMDGLHILIEQGTVMYLGISDTPAWIVSAANEYALANGKTPFVIYQGKWNVMDRDFEREILPMARHYGMALAPWSVLGGGRFKSKAQLEAKKAEGETLRAFAQPSEQTPLEAKFSSVLERIGSKYGVTSPATVALAYVLHKVPNVFPIVGGRKVEQLEENIKALYINLTLEEIQEIESVDPSFDLGFPLNFISPPPPANGGKGQKILPPAGVIDWVLDPKAVTRPPPASGAK